MTRRGYDPLRYDGDRLIGEVNTTPLIDVLLVLLIIFIISIPMATHKVEVPLPAVGGANVEPIVQRLHLGRDGAVFWNGAAVAEETLPGRLTAVRSEPQAVLHLSADGDARYEDYDRILAAVKRAGIDKLGLVGNQAFAKSIDG
jgi:biopolymer transport protein ExbD